MVSITGIILAGGASRRMGQNKAKLPWGKTSLIQHVVETLQICLQPLIVVGTPGVTLPELPDTVISTCDIKPFLGPLAGFARGLALAPAHQPVFLTGCDFPLLKCSVIDFIYQHLGSFDAAVPCIDGICQPLAAIYHPAITSQVSETLEQGFQSMTDLLQRLRCFLISKQEWELFDPGARMLLNVNTSDEYGNAQQAYLASLAGRS